MASSVEHIAESIFKIIKGFGHNIVLFTDTGKKTVDPTEARRFFAKDIQMMVNLVVDETTSEVIVNLSKDTDIPSISPMLSGLRNLANRYILEYTVKTFGKTIGPKDFSFMAKQQTNESSWGGAQAEGTVKKMKDGGWWAKNQEGTMKTFKDEKAARKFAKSGDPDLAPKRVDETREMTKAAIMKKIKDGKWEATQDVKPGKHVEIRNTESGKRMQVMVKEDAQLDEGFSGWHGSARKSINELGDAKIVVKHKRSIDEEKRGARSRQIESIFIENSEGERFKFPTNNLTAAKAMCRHVKEGGTPFDDFGQYIYETMEELNELKKFQRKNRRNDFFEDAQIGEEIGNRVSQLRTNLKQMAGTKGYAHHFETFARENADVDKEKLDELKDNVTVRYFDESIAASLPYVARVIENMRGRQAREAEVVDFARYVMDNKDNIGLNRPIDGDDPDSPAARRFKDPATAIAAWVSYLAPMIKDDMLANKMMQVSDSVFQVGNKHLNMAAAAINVIRQKGRVSEEQELTSEGESVYEEELDRINETFAKYSDTRKLFGA